MNRPIESNYINADGLDKCTHCGFCLPTCPTYEQLGQEMDSPRGRLYLMKAALEGRSEMEERFETHMYRCLECRACETACPSGVPFGVLMEQARAMYEASGRRPWTQRLLMRLVYRSLLPRQKRLRFLFALMRLYQRSGMQTLVRKTGLLRLFGRRAKEMEALAPPLPSGRFLRQMKEVSPAQGERRCRVGFVAGCVMQPMFADVNLATVRVLTRNGCEVVTPKRQACCGALHLHNGVREEAKRLAKQNIDLFLDEELDAVVINSAGCGAALKEYGELFEDDPEMRERAETFSAKMRDVSEWLAEIGIEPPQHPIELRATYDDPCHLLHGQKVRAEPRKLIQSVPGLVFEEMREADWCCGSAGIYNILQPEIAAQTLERKMPHVEAAQADLLITANPGCMIQLRAGIQQRGLQTRTLHIMELLDWAYTGEEPDSIRRGF